MTLFNSNFIDGAVTLINDNKTICLYCFINNYKLDYLESLVSKESKEIKYKKIISNKKKIKHLLVRYILKKIFSQLLSIEIIFKNKDSGKLIIENNNKFDFNVSYSHKIVVIVISKINPIGVDIEFIDENKKNILKNFLSKRSELFKQEMSLNELYHLWVSEESKVKVMEKSILISEKNKKLRTKIKNINDDYLISIATKEDDFPKLNINYFEVNLDES